MNTTTLAATSLTFTVTTTLWFGSPQTAHLDALKELARAQSGKVRTTLHVDQPMAGLPLLAAGSELIVQGYISHAVARAEGDDDSSWVSTYFTVVPTRIFKNSIGVGVASTAGPTTPITFVEFGGTINVDGLDIRSESNNSPDPPLQVGEAIIVFLVRKPDTDVFWVHYGPYGILRIRDGKVFAANSNVAKIRPIEDNHLNNVQRLIADLVGSDKRP